MHVILLSFEYPPFVSGGIGTFTRDLAQGLLRRGTKVTVISGFPITHTHMQRSNINQKSEDGITVIRFPYPNIPARPTMFHLINFNNLCKTIDNIGADIIQGQGSAVFPTLLNLRHIAPIIATFHADLTLLMRLGVHSLTRGGSLGDFCKHVLGYPLSRYTCKKTFQGSNAAVAVSETLMKQLILKMGSNRLGKILYIHNGVDLEMLDKESLNTFCYKEEKEPIIFFGGRLNWSKGVLNLVRLAYLLEKRLHLNLKIVICGRGPLYRKIKQEMLKLNLTNIALKGFVNRTEFMNTMKKAMCVVIPGFQEICPMILLECMCTGKIPIMFNLPYARELTQNGKYGILVNTVEGMAQKIKLMYNRSDLEQTENRIRNFARKKYDINETALKYYQLYRDICN